MPLEYCPHVYRNMSQNPCPLCDKDTHETNWTKIAELRKQHYAEGKHLKYICSDCGGTIRGWWDI